MLCSFAASGLVLEKSQVSFQQDRRESSGFVCGFHKLRGESLGRGFGRRYKTCN